MYMLNKRSYMVYKTKSNRLYVLCIIYKIIETRTREGAREGRMENV